MPRPYRVKNGIIKGRIASISCSIMLVFYVPGMTSGLDIPELTIAMIWTLFGFVAFFLAKIRKQNVEEEQ